MDFTAPLTVIQFRAQAAFTRYLSAFLALLSLDWVRAKIDVMKVSTPPEPTERLKETTESSNVRRVPMSYEAYLSYGEEAVRTEWVDGEVVVYMPPKAEHQRLLAFLERLLALFVSLKGLGEVNIAPFEVKLWEDGPSREPDIFFLIGEQLNDLSAERFSGAPALAVEIISPSSLFIDRNTKLREYERAGVKEYWVVDSRPGKAAADFFRLDDTGRYDLFATETDETVHSSVVEGFWLRPEWLWQPDLNPLQALAEIVGKEALIEALQDDADHSSDSS